MYHSIAIVLENDEHFVISPLGHLVFMLSNCPLSVRDFVPINIPGMEDEEGVWEDKDEDEGLYEILMPPGKGVLFVGEEPLSFLWDAQKFQVREEIIFDEKIHLEGEPLTVYKLGSCL